MPATVSEFYQSLKVDHVVNIFIADENKPICIPEKLLINTSPYFAGTVAPEDECSRQCVLKYPHDNLDAWKLLLYCIFHKEMPREEDPLFENDCHPFHLISCWCLGEKYGITAFQDAIIFELIDYMWNGNTLSLEAIRVGFEDSPHDSPLRLLVVDTVVEQLMVTKEITYKDLDLFDGVAGFSGALLESVSCWHSQGRRMFSGKRWKKFTLHAASKPFWVENKDS